MRNAVATRAACECFHSFFELQKHDFQLIRARIISNLKCKSKKTGYGQDGGAIKLVVVADTVLLPS